ncbi:MAG: TonB-dependent receptor [Bacteroides sp.]|nr:TonB-dependent receptor [Bacteroides sp.]
MKKASWLKAHFLIVCFLLTSIFAFSQEKVVTGSVTDSSGEPLIGVSILVQGTTNGIVTDLNGKYTIKVKPGETLDFSYIGMTKQSVKVGNQSIINIQMKDDSQVLAETVVIGYGSAKRRDLTGAIGNVNSESLLKQPALSPVQSAQGKISGVNIINNDAPGSTPTIVIRGLGTALSGRDPLYIVDGFPVTDIKNISASDIVSMDILKDASSSSIYGIRAANGVVIITTKKGQEGKTKIAIDSYYGIKNVSNKVKMANASQYINYFNENQTSTGASWQLADVAKQGYNTDWYDELTQTGTFNNNSISLTGGGKSIDYFFSYNYYKENGILDNQDYQRSTIRNNNTYKLFDNRLSIKQNLNVSFTREHQKPYDAFTEAYRQSPLVPVMYANGRYGQPFVNTTTGVVTYEAGTGETVGKLNSIGNPLFTVDNYNQYNKTVTIQGGIDGELKITDFLKFNSRFGATKYYSNERNFSNIKNAWLNADPTRTESDFESLKESNAGVTTYANNSLQFVKNETFRWVWENFFSFDKSFDKHHISATLGASREKYNIGNTSTLKGYDVPDKSQYWSISHASGDYTTDDIIQYDYTPTALASYFARVQYNYANKYYFSGTLRRDGSSTFKSSNSYWGTFPSFGLGWTITNESFMQNIKWLEYLKLRGNWGKLGNQNVPLNVSQILTSTGSSNYNYVLGSNQALVYGAAFGTPAVGLSWEITKEWGLGADFSLFNSRLSGTIDYYNKTNTNAILNISPISDSMYSDDYYDHAAKINNRGLEVSLSWKDQFANGLKYDISVNVSHNTNEVKEVNSSYTGQTGGSLSNGQITKKLAKGEPVFAWWMWETDGVWQNQAEIDANPHYGSPKPGYLKYKDQNGDKVIDDRDKVFLGSYLPTYNYGLHIGLNYKQIDFNIDGYGVGGNKVYNGLKGTRINGGENISYDTYKNRWTGENSTNSNPGAGRDSYASSYYLESGAFFRINNITLGYTFNDIIMKGSNLRLYLTAQNPFIITGYKGYSPEVTTTDGAPNGTTGIELSAYPTTRNFLVGLNLSF